MLSSSVPCSNVFPSTMLMILFTWILISNLLLFRQWKVMRKERILEIFWMVLLLPYFSNTCHVVLMVLNRSLPMHCVLSMNALKCVDMVSLELQELRKDGFDLAEARYRELKPILDEVILLICFPRCVWCCQPKMKHNYINKSMASCLSSSCAYSWPY